jgi:hypothetical protein
VSDQPLKIIVVLADGSHEFAIEPGTARAILAENSQVPATDDRSELQELLLHYFAEGLHLHRRRSRSDIDQEYLSFVHMSEIECGFFLLYAV